VGPRASLDDVEKREILHCWESNPSRPARRYTDIGSAVGIRNVARRQGTERFNLHMSRIVMPIDYIMVLDPNTATTLLLGKPQGTSAVG
jgi:hypothetical protein